MKSNHIMELIKGNQLVLPSSLLKHYKDLKINHKELVFLSYLLPLGESISFDVNVIGEAINYDANDVMEVTSSLCEKSLLSLTVKKDGQELLKDYLDISYLYNKLLSLTMGEEANIPVIEVMEEENIYETIEKEFGRTLSPIEYELVKAWLDSNITQGLIREALKEAVLNGVNNLKYIDKILIEWTKKGYKEAYDIKKKSNSEEIVDLFDYNWLKDNEED